MTFRKIHLSYLDELENNVIIVLVDQGMLNILLARSSIFHLFSSFQLIFKITRVCLNFVHPSFGEHLPETGATQNPQLLLDWSFFVTARQETPCLVEGAQNTGRKESKLSFYFLCESAPHVFTFTFKWIDPV